jgi:hypothetical protein
VTRRSSLLATGQSLVEFALVIPMFLALLFAIVDVGRVVWASNTLSNAAREATRFAIVHGGSKSNTCPVGPPTTFTVIPPASPSCPYPSPSKQAIVDVARSFAVAAGSGLTITVCYGASCSGDTDLTTNKRGEPVTVRISSTIGLITGAIVGNGTYTITGDSTMLVNH